METRLLIHGALPCHSPPAFKIISTAGAVDGVVQYVRDGFASNVRAGNKSRGRPAVPYGTTYSAAGVQKRQCECNGSDLVTPLAY